MESKLSKNYKIAVVGNDLLKTGFRLVGVTESYATEGAEETENVLRTLMKKEDIGIIVVTSRVVKGLRDRRLSEAVESSTMPLIVEVPEYGEEATSSGDSLKRIILRAIGIDISKSALA